MSDRLRRAGGRILSFGQLALFSLLLLGTRCANYQAVFVEGKAYFVDADCYSRMTRARLVFEHPGVIVRHHDFENFPNGINPHTTAPLDYLIALLAATLRPLSAQPLDLAGAFISPLLALFAGWFLWWWSRQFAGPARWLMLAIYLFSGILVHGTALGRPDQQALLIVLLLVALAAEWELQVKPTVAWGATGGIAWGSALWVSLYEPFILLFTLLIVLVCGDRLRLTARPRRISAWLLLAVLSLAAVIERRLPEWPVSEPFFANWSATIGELHFVSLLDRSWLDWVGGLLLVSPFLLWTVARRRLPGWLLIVPLLLTFGLTLAQARWSYFFALLFLLLVPLQLSLVRRKSWLLGLVVLTLAPLAFFWDARFWPNENDALRQSASRAENVAWRAAATALAGRESAPILAPWWLAPATAYWSRQPVVAGSSHESLPGIVESARFYLSKSPEEARAILRKRMVQWVLAGDSDEVTVNAAAILDQPVPQGSLVQIMDRYPSRVPSWLQLAGQNSACKIYRVQPLP